MQGIFSTISRMRQLQVITLVNRIIYFMQKIPVVGRFFSEQTYAAFWTKRIIGAIAVILMFVAGLLESLFYIGGMLALPIVLWTEGYNTPERFALLLHMYFCISGVMAGMTSAKVLESNKMKYTAVRLIRIVPTKYMRAVLFYRYITFFLYQGIAITLVSLFFNFSIFHALLTVGVMTIWRMMSEFLHLAVFRWKGTILVQKTWVMGLVMILTLTAAYLPLTSRSIPLFGAVILDQQWLVTLIWLSGTVAGYVLLKHTNYTAAVRAVTNQSDPLLNTEIMMANLQQQMVQAKDNDYGKHSSSNLHACEQTSLGKKGYEQMHNLLVSRYNHLIQVPFRRRLVAIMIIGLLLSFLAFIFRDHVSLNSLERFTPVLIMAMLSLTIGREVCKGLFYHCDMQLMRYSFYRKHAKQHFRLRFRSLLFLNLKLGACVATVLSVSILVLSEGRDTSTLLPVWCMTMALSVFFSVHHLLVYYVFQPYTTELETNNPLFTLVNSLISLGFVVAMLLGPTLWVLTVVLIVLTVGYLLSAVPLVSKYAQTHFRVK
ncbi:hypothetical protein [Paenibacillus pabuli]|uniref:hypothetical protein n=1 Tax=Paenibacillus pabuli TaxID=1472 RepID=UPI001FFFB7F7|nr:hypothetical protein [Paenibacillus pabuli]UPK41302.1 hypothetical protein KET34_18620 [Paenibacillus pabuli]